MFPTTPVILVLGLTVATCVIAYWADNLGKKLGKKRLSLFGLRPRQTATVISMATSVGIMALTLIVLLASSVSLRNALLNYDYIKHVANEEKRKAEEARKQARDAREQLKYAGDQLQKTEVRLHDEQRNVTMARSRTGKARAELTRAQSRLKNAQNAEKSARIAQAGARRGEAQARQAERTAMSAQRAAMSRAVGLSKQLGTSRVALRDNSEKLSEGRRELGRVTREAKDLRRRARELGRSNRELLARENELNTKIDEINGRLGQLEKRRAELESGIQTTQAYFQQAADMAMDYGTLVAELGAGNVAFKLGHVFAEATIPPSSDPSRIRASIRELVSQANAVANLPEKPPTDEASTPADAQPNRVLRLAPRFTGPNGQGEIVSEEAQIAQYANLLSTFTVPVSVRVVAARNFARAETNIFAVLQRVPVKRVFVSGETISSSVIDGNATDAEIFNALLDLVNAGERVARDRGMNPLVTAANPEFYSMDTNERIFEALREVQMQVRQVRVRLVAVQDSRTTDNLRVRLVIERLAT